MGPYFLLENKALRDYLSSMLSDLYYEMLRIRLIEEAIAAKYSEQEMRCPVHLSIGQEAVAVGVSATLKETDLVVSGHRAHAHFLAKGGSLKKMLAEIYGRESGCCIGRGGSMHLTDLEAGFLCSTPIVGGSIPVGVGAAWAEKLQGKNSKVIIYFGEGATEEGVFAESLNFAALKSLPVLFVCENNLYSVYSPMNVRQCPNRDRAAIAGAHSIPTLTGNGNDVLEVLKKTKEAIEVMETCSGPAYLEFNTYRHLEHCGPNFDNHIGYRTEEEFLTHFKDCPIEKYKSQVHESSHFEIKIKAEIKEAFAFAQKSAFPSFDPKKEKLYAELT